MSHAPHRPTITAAVIALNEAAHLSGWLEATDWADERLVIDGGSTDATVNIARRAGVRVEQHPFDDFARQRNRALALARGDWVLFVDADERPTPALVSEIRHRTAHSDHAGYRVPIRSRIFGRPFRFCGTQDDRPVRLVRRGQGRWVGEVHEVLRISGSVSALEHHLQHETMPDVWTFLRKMIRYTELEAQSRVLAGRPWRRRDQWLAPPREVFRRLIWKHGWLDGPRGWAFCLLSGLSEWVQAARHRELEELRRREAAMRRWLAATETYPEPMTPPPHVPMPTADEPAVTAFTRSSSW